ncbi:MFS transporter, partial [Sphaerisporangium fuscum]|uniref:MFS transporter n=1 Tax=Sphaerisporangium fuscum TaxID=2835868 RepID=UPI001BDC0501
NVPLTALAIGLSFPLIAPDPAVPRGRVFDLPGALTATVGVTLIVFVLVQGPESGWGSPLIIASAAVALALLAAFLLIEARSKDPLLPLSLFRNRNLNAGIGTTFLFGTTLNVLLYFLTIYFQNVHGYSALGTGTAFLAPMVAVLIGANAGGRLATKFGIRTTLAISLPVAALGAVLVALTMSGTGSYAALLPGLVILGLGQGSTFTVMFAGAATGVPADEQGVASATASTGMQIGTSVGLALLVAVSNSALTPGLTGQALRAATADGLRTAVFVIAAGLVLALAVALTFRHHHHNEIPVPATH